MKTRIKALGYGFIVWCALVIEIAALAVLSPEFGLAGWWMIIIAFIMCQFWFAWRLTFRQHIHHNIASVLALLFRWFYRLWKWISKGLRLRQRVSLDFNKPKPVADKSTSVVGTHPKILRRPTRVVLGYDRRENPISIDLGLKHTLIGASTGGGKTNTIVSILLQLFSKPKAKRPVIHIIDLKCHIDDRLITLAPIANSYVSEIEPAVRLLRDLVVEMNRRNREGDTKKSIVLVIDEVADLTAGTEQQEYRRTAVRLLTLLARKARSARISLMIATQHARYDVLDKSIAYNLLRKICLPVDTKGQAEVILGFKPEFKLPRQPGEFILKDGLGNKRGRSLLVQTSEVDALVAAQFEDFGDPRLKLWKAVACGKKVGQSAIGIGRMHSENPEFGQNDVKFGYRNLALAGVLKPPAKKGATYRIAVGFIPGVAIIRTFIGEGKWMKAPRPFLR